MACEDCHMNTSHLTAEAFAKRVAWLRWGLLCLWASVTFCVAFFARDLSFVMFERPVGFWMAAQGSVLVFLAITWVYALLVNHWERQASLPSASKQAD